MKTIKTDKQFHKWINFVKICDYGCVGGPKKILIAPSAYWDLSIKDLEKITNGCGPKELGFLIPDKIWGLSIAPACNIHDYMYYAGKNNNDKLIADGLLYQNILRIILHYPGNKFLKSIRRFRARTYTYNVVMYGKDAFWATKPLDLASKAIKEDRYA